MEPSEFDKLIQDKLREDNSIHAHEIEKSKPFIWTAIQNNLKKGAFVFQWYQVAAAIVLFLICSSFLFYSMQLNHQTELASLNFKVESLKKYYDQQAAVIIKKNDELLTICDEVDQLELAVKELHEIKPKTRNKQLIVYRSDTVYVNRVEYVTQILDTIKKTKIKLNTNEDLVENSNAESLELTESSQLIYPNYKKLKVKPAENELLKFKFSAHSFQ